MNMTNPVLQLFICGVVQLLLAVPFLYTSPLNYLLGAFNLGRVFLFQWTVNFRYTDR
jgi:alpha-1,3-mannosyltransferase